MEPTVVTPEKYNIVDSNEANGNNFYYIIEDTEVNRKYVVMHVVKGKFAIYDYEHHDVISKFTWQPCNGMAVCMLREQHLALFPDMPYQVNRLIYMHLVIKDYCMKEPKNTDKHVLHHINERCRDNRRENMIWIHRNCHRALLKKIGKCWKPPVECREKMPFLPKFCRWINAKKLFRCENHPANFIAVENKQEKHKYIESLKGKKHTLQAKFEDFVQKYEALMNKPFGGQESYYKYEEFKESLEKTNKALCVIASTKAMENAGLVETQKRHIDEVVEEKIVVSDDEDGSHSSGDDEEICDGNDGDTEYSDYI